MEDVGRLGQNASSSVTFRVTGLTVVGAGLAPKIAPVPKKRRPELGWKNDNVRTGARQAAATELPGGRANEGRWSPRATLGFLIVTCGAFWCAAGWIVVTAFGRLSSLPD